MTISEQLAPLRRTVARIDDKYGALSSTASSGSRPSPETDPAGFVEELLTGEVVETPLGSHFETEKLYGRRQRHGSYDIAELIDLPPDFLASLSAGEISGAHPATWAFLDTETTGLAGGSGTCAFLIGVGCIDAEGFRVRQFFMREYCEERSMLHSLSAYLARFDVLITYNGKTFDQPLLETRYTMARARHPFSRMAHLDLLHGARRLFKLRLESCRLVNLERRILGLEREADVPGDLIPYYYFEYLRTRVAFRLIPIFHHNVLDIVSLACLTGLIPAAFRDPESAQTGLVTLKHGTDLLGLARWLQASGRLEEALRLTRRAVDLGLDDRHLFGALFEAGLLEKKLGLADMAVATFTDLSLSPNPWRCRAYEELAKHYEHREKNYRMALECVLAARNAQDAECLRLRQRRLENRCAKRSGQRKLTISAR
ncbi:MAG: ribonuclease H-like domain-containing protein [Acidobacteriota bacterium]|nr:ribonuclease H-like domain-containing protein [Acidobacteriota bacterium]